MTPRLHQTMALASGTRLGHYNVTAIIGEGGMGQVWLHVRARAAST